MATYKYCQCQSSWLSSLEGGLPRMSRHSPFTIHLSRKEREILESRARKYTLPYFEVLRAKIILLAAQGSANDEIAAALSVGRDVVSLWRKRFFQQRLPGLEERPRPGRPRVFPPRAGGSDQGACL
jgi:Winged helix-turn helix